MWYVWKMAPKPLAAIAGEATDPLLEAIARAPLGAPESVEERAAVEASMAESNTGLNAVDHEVIVRKIAAARR